MDEYLDQLSYEILGYVSNDYEPYDRIVIELSTQNPRPTKDQIDAAIVRLSDQGLIRAYHLSAFKPHVTEVNVRECAIEKTYFYVTHEGKAQL